LRVTHGFAWTGIHITIHKANFESRRLFEMAQDLNIYDEVEIEDMVFDKTLQIYHYPCPCGDRFEIGIADLRDGEEIAVCPGCSLMIKVIFDLVLKVSSMHL
jgi:diphthamide biosynthesis protein 3